MKLNKNIMVVGNSVCLVPYNAHHVSKYHNWMQNKDLQFLTASEPLSLAEEYEMQQSWSTDEDKLTFIAISGNSIPQSKDEEVERMIGDVNLFFIFSPEEAEINIMLAETKHRRGGYGSEVLNLMMNYAKNNLPISKFSAKITNSNLASMKFFERNGFDKISVSEVFEETTYELPCDKKEGIVLNMIPYPFSESASIGS